MHDFGRRLARTEAKIGANRAHAPLAHALHCPSSLAWSEAAPPAPLRGHFFLICRAARLKNDDFHQIPNDHVVTIHGRVETPLIVAKPLRGHERPGAKVK